MSDQGVVERWRHAAREVSGLCKSTTQFREDVADEAVRVVLEHLRNIAAEDRNLDDGLWYRRFEALLSASSTASGQKERNDG